MLFAVKQTPTRMISLLSKFNFTLEITVEINTVTFTACSGKEKRTRRTSDCYLLLPALLFLIQASLFTQSQRGKDAPGSTRPSTTSPNPHEKSHDLRCQHIWLGWSFTPSTSINSCMKSRNKVTSCRDCSNTKGLVSCTGCSLHRKCGVNLMFA